MSFYFSQRSSNRVPENYLVNLETNPLLREQLAIGFKPLEQVAYLRKMIEVFQFDLKFYGQHQSLFANGCDDLL